MDIPSKIVHERKLALIFNFAYELVGQGVVSDAIYEYGISRLREFKNKYPYEWGTCNFYKEYFVDNDDWEYTGSGVPTTSEVKELYEQFVANGNTLWKNKDVDNDDSI